MRSGLRPGPRWGSLQRSPRPLAVFEGSITKGEGKRGEREKGRKGKGKGREGETR